MSDTVVSWFYNQDGDRKGPFTPEQIGTLIQAGVVGEHTKMWSEAVGDWTPLFRTELRTLLGDKAIEPPPPPQKEEPATPPANVPPPWAASWSPSQPLDPAVGTAHGARGAEARPASSSATSQVDSHPLRDNSVLAKNLYGVLEASAVFSFLMAVYIGKAAGIEGKYLAARNLETGVWLAADLILSLVATALFLCWKYRSTANLWRLRGRRTITPAGAVYWYFVPIAWFWKPYEAMRNLFDGFGVGAGHRKYLIGWWFLFLGGVALAILAATFGEEPIRTLQQANLYVGFSIAFYVTYAICCHVAAELVKHIAAAEANSLQ